MDDAGVEMLVYNILPGGDTILHKLSDHGEIIRSIFALAHPNEEDVTEVRFHVPFLQNFFEESPMHISKVNHDLRTVDTYYRYLQAYGMDHHSRAMFDLVAYAIEKKLPNLLDYINSRLQSINQVANIKKGCPLENHIGITDLPLWFNMNDFSTRLMA